MDSKTVWIEVFKTALANYGIERAARVANEAVDAFDKRFAPEATKPVEKKPEVKPTEVKA